MRSIDAAAELLIKSGYIMEQRFRYFDDVEHFQIYLEEQPELMLSIDVEAFEHIKERFPDYNVEDVSERSDVIRKIFRVTLS